MNKDETQAIIQQIKKGDLSVLEHVYVKFRAPFLKFGSRYGLSQEDLLDIYQDSLLAFVDNVSNGKVLSLNSSLKTYLFSIGKFMIFRKIKRLEKVDAKTFDTERLELYAQETEADTAFDPDDIAYFKACIGNLGKQCQELLNLFYYRGFTLDEIQEQLGYDNYHVVKSQKWRCLKHLKTLIEKKRNE